MLTIHRTIHESDDTRIYVGQVGEQKCIVKLVSFNYHLQYSDVREYQHERKLYKLLNTSFEDGFPRLIGNTSPIEGWNGIVLEYVEAQNLKDLINQGQITESEFLLIMC